MFGVSKKIKVTTLYITKVIYSVVIFMLQCGYEFNKSEFMEENQMDIWERMYEKAKEQYHPEEVSPFIYAHNVVCAIEAENGDIYTGFCIESCCGVMNICADRLAALNMYANSGQTRMKRFIAFRDSAPNGGGSGMPCGACQEFFYQLNEATDPGDLQILLTLPVSP